jgi:hypothetical protein
VVPLKSEDLVGNLVELLHLALSKQSAEFFHVQCFIEGTGNSQLFFFLLYLVSIVVPDVYVFPTVLLLFLLMI